MAEEKEDLEKKLDNFQYATWLIKVIAILMAFILPIFSKLALIFFSAAMMPSIVVIFIDRALHKCFSATIITFNIIGLLPYFKRLWVSNIIDLEVKAILYDPFTWVIIYTTTLLGFIVYYTIPALISHIYIAKANVKIKNLIDKRQKIAEEWQIKIKDFDNV